MGKGARFRLSAEILPSACPSEPAEESKASESYSEIKFTPQIYSSFGRLRMTGGRKWACKGIIRTEKKLWVKVWINNTIFPIFLRNPLLLFHSIKTFKK